MSPLSVEKPVHGPLNKADPRKPFTWKGVSHDERDLMAQHVAAGSLEPLELATAVPFGTVPAGTLAAAKATGLNHAPYLYAKKADAVIRDRQGIWAAEIKHAAGYVALGQALLAADLIPQSHPQYEGIRPLIVTDRADPDIHAIAARLGVRILELPGMPYRPIGRPT
jgi:hypothetical protein